MYANRIAAFLAIAMAASISTAQPRIGDVSPEFGIEQLLNAPPGAEAALEALQGKFVVLEFWATWCGPCVGAIPHLNELHAAYKDRVVFISVTDEDRATVEAFQEDEPVIANWIGIDADRSLFDAYGVRGIPHTVVLDQNGRIAAITHPFNLTPERLDAYLTGERQRETATPAGSGSSPRERTIASFAAGLIAGHDPLDGLQAGPHMQFILRPAAVRDEDFNQFGTTMDNRVTAMKITRDAVVRYLYGDMPPSMVDLSDVEPSDRLYDLIIGGGFPLEDARRLALSVFGLEEHREVRPVASYRLKLTGEAPTNTAEPSSGSDARVHYRSDSFRYTDSQMPIGLLAEAVGGWLGSTCENATGLEDTLLKMDLTVALPVRPDAMARLLEEAHALTIEPYETDREVVVIRPARRDAADRSE